MKREIKINKQIKKLKDRIFMVVNDRILDQVEDDIGDEITELIEKLDIDFDNQKVVDYAYEELRKAIVKLLIKRLN